MAAHKNTFEKGSQLGVHPWVQRPDTATVLENTRLLSKENTSMVVQAMPSTSVLESLPAGALVYGSANYNGICYLLLYYPGVGNAVGETEIGCYPSPNPNYEDQSSTVSIKGVSYSHNQMLPKYAAFRNLKKIVQPGIPAIYGDFRTTFMPISQDSEVEMIIQPDYDGTVNVIFTDGENPIRLINSRFSLLPDDRFELIDRQGANDTNLYDELTLSTSLKLLLESFSVVKVDLDEVSDGGSVKGGNYRYYFSYENSDGNTTDIVAESGLVQVFAGNTIGLVHGVEENQSASRQVRISLSGLDIAYSRLRVYFSYAAGDVSSQTILYRFANTYSFSSATLLFIHDGTEAVAVTDQSVVERGFASIGTVKSLTQIGSYLVGANVKESPSDNASLSAFAKNVFACNTIPNPNARMSSLESTPMSDSMEELYTHKINQKDANLMGLHNGGYANPKNTYYRLGYQDAESYAFGIVYILTDGSLSPVFPVTGIDNLDYKYQNVEGGYTQIGSDGPVYDANPNVYPPTITLSTVNALDQSEPYTETTGLNSLGILRFPRRSARHSERLLTADGISINGVMFNIPTVKPANTVGCFFVRAPRKANRIAEGYLLPTFKLLQAETVFYGHTDMSFPQISNKNNYRVLPICGGVLETVRMSAAGKVGTNNSGTFTLAQNRHRMIRVRKNGVGGNNTPRGYALIDNKRAAFICPDSFGSPTALSQRMNGQPFTLDVTSKVLGKASAVRDLLNEVLVGVTPMLSKQLVSSVIQTLSISPLRIEFLGTPFNPIMASAPVSYVAKDQNSENAYSFTSRSEGYLGFRTRHMLKGGAFQTFAASYNDYFGVQLTDGETRLTGLLPDIWPNPASNEWHSADGDWYASGTENFSNIDFDMAYLAGIYPGDGPESTRDLINKYKNIESLSYLPISQRMLWPEVEQKLDPDRNITCYGGDCYTTVSFRRLYHANTDPGARRSLQSDTPWFDETSTNNRVGQSLTLCTQNNTNTYLRGIDNIAVSGKKSVSLPRIEGSSTDIRDWRQRIYTRTEPEVYNKGYNIIPQGKSYLAFAFSAPYLANHWFNRIISLGPHVLGNFANAYRQWNGASYQDYETQFGQIVSVKAVDNNLACIWESAAGFIPFRERTYAGESATGQVFVEQNTVLGPQAKIISSLYGSRHPSSLVVTDNAIYGVDAQSKKIWMMTPGGLNHFSDYSIHPLLEKFTSGYANQKIRQGKENIVAGFNSFFSEIWFTYLSDSNPQNSFTFVFNEKYASQGMVYYSGTVGIFPYRYLRFGDGMLSLDSKQSSNVLHFHDDYGEGFLKMYGQPKAMKLGFVVNNDPDRDKVYKHLKIASNRTMPVRVTYTTDGASVIQEIVAYNGSNLMDANGEYTNGCAHIPIPDTETVTDDPVSAYLRRTLGNYESEVLPDANLQGRAMEVVLEYRGDKPIEILSVTTQTDVSL